MTADNQTQERLATDAFVNAVYDDQIREKLRDKAPVSISEALRNVRQIAVNREIEKQRVKQSARSVEVKTEENAEMKELRTKLAKLETELQKFNAEKPSFKRERKAIICRYCHLPGHIERYCPFNPNNQLIPSGKVQLTDEMMKKLQGNGKGQTS